MTYRDEFVAGFGIACADLVRLHDQPSMAYDVMNGAGFKVADFKRAGLDEYDLKVIRKVFRDCTPKSRPRNGSKPVGDRPRSGLDGEAARAGSAESGCAHPTSSGDL